MKKTFTINGKKVDLSQAAPITLGDMKALKKKGINVNGEDFQEGDPEQIGGFVLHMAQKVNAEITEEDVDQVEFMEELGQMAQAIFGETENVDRPT